MYRFCRYRRDTNGQIESKIFEIEDKSLLKDYLKTEEKGWYKHHMLVPSLNQETESVPEPEECDDVLALLKGEGLNHSSFTRLRYGKTIIEQKDKNKTKKEYDAILAKYKGRIRKQNKDWFLNDST